MEEQDQTASGLLLDNGKIDMSLDDIIKLQNEETHTESNENPRSQRSKAGSGNFQNNYFRGAQRNQQGSSRYRFGFKQGYSGINLRNNQTGPVTRRRAAISGVSPLNRQNPNIKRIQTRLQAQNQQRRPQQQKRFRPAIIPVQIVTKKVNAQNRRPHFGSTQRQQRSNAANQNGRLTQQIALIPGKRQQNARRWQTAKGFGSTLTVSVENCTPSQTKTPNKPGVIRPGPRFRKTATQSKYPKGVPLRFNFRATANHTSVTLNERFSSLKIKGQIAPARRGGRTVLLA
ncbi:UAP56-interacting factor-like [Pelodytes ibericus]